MRWGDVCRICLAQERDHLAGCCEYGNEQFYSLSALAKRLLASKEDSSIYLLVSKNFRNL
jgi:hypothetical protein